MAVSNGAIVLTHANGEQEVLWAPTPKQILAHASHAPYLLLHGSRGTGKSSWLRWDFHMRAMSVPNYTYLILRRTVPELRKSHLLFIGSEMEKLGGTFLKTTGEAHYPNGSVGIFAHCETEDDINRYLSAQFAAIGYDEVNTFTWDMITRINSSARVTKASGLTAVVRACTNPMGVGADDVFRYWVEKSVDKDEDPEYNPDDWQNIFLSLDDNPHLDVDAYRKQFAGLPEIYRKAWMMGEWGVEGSYFDLEAKHLLQDMPIIEHQSANHGPLIHQEMVDCKWLHIYRIIDWGWHDPTVCLWVAVLPNGREIPFKEKMWLRTTAQQVAADIKQESGGMKVITTLADPTLWDGLKEMGSCMADVFEYAGVPLTRAKNDRVACGRAIQEHLNATLDDGKSKAQIYEPGCPTLVRALRAMRVDKKHPGRIADSKLDHLPICFGYFCMSGVAPSQPPNASVVPRWMQKPTRKVLGSEGVRSKG